MTRFYKNVHVTMSTRTADLFIFLNKEIHIMRNIVDLSN